MQSKKILKAALNTKNSILLAAVLIISLITRYIPFLFIGMAGYVYFVMQTLKNDTCEEDEFSNLHELNKQCNDLYIKAYNVLNAEMLKEVEVIMKNKDELINLFFKDKANYAKQKVIEQAINLAIAYIKLAENYCKRIDEINSINTNEIMDEINANERKLSFLNDHQAIEDIKNSIEMSRKILTKVEQRKRELERISAKLTYIESTFKVFKHQIVMSEDTTGTTAEIESIINEAKALNSVLDEEKINRIRL